MYGHMPYGLKDIKLTNIGGTTQVDLPAAQTLEFNERIVSGELKGDDTLKAVVAHSEAVEWTLSNGGISLEAYALMTGRTAATSGTTPNETTTLTGEGGEHFPYFKIYGKSVGEASTDDIHVKLWKAKLTSISGTFQNEQFFITSCSGIAVDDGSNGIFDIVQNETEADLPAS